MSAPAPVIDRFSDEIKQLTIKLFNDGWTHTEIGEYYGEPERTIAKLCKHLGLKRSRSEAASLKIKSKLDNEVDLQFIRDNRDSMSLGEIAIALCTSVSSVQRICDKYNIAFDNKIMRERLIEKLINAWDDDKRLTAKLVASNVSDETRIKISVRSRAARLQNNHGND
jgi:hypothetical protein